MRGSTRMADKPPCRVPGETNKRNVTTEQNRERAAAAKLSTPHQPIAVIPRKNEEEERERETKARKLKETKRKTRRSKGKLRNPVSETDTPAPRPSPTLMGEGINQRDVRARADISLELTEGGQATKRVCKLLNKPSPLDEFSTLLMTPRPTIRSNPKHFRIRKNPEQPR